MDRLTHHAWHRLAAGVFCALGVLVSGCQTLNPGGWFGASKKSEDEAYREMADTEDVVGPLERLLTFRQEKNKQLKYIPGYHEKGQDELLAAERIYNAGRLDEAEAEFERIAKQFDRYAVREDALFFLAETYFKQQDYPKAQDEYDALVKEYPATRYKDEISKRMFTIAGTWLRFPDVVTPSDVKQASNVEESGKTEIADRSEGTLDPTLKYPLLPNFHDSTRPVFDTEGRALQALKSIWLDNPSSPLADDALMMTASHYLRNGKHELADDYYAIIRTHYPKSPHFENAYVLGSHVKLMSYQGPEYDGGRLNEAAQLKDSYLRMYPNAEHAARAEADLKKLDEAAAMREWERVEFYMKKGRPDSAAVYAREILRLYPDAKIAKSAREFMTKHGNPVAQNKADSGWDWNFFPKLERVPEDPPAETKSQAGRVTIEAEPAAPGRANFSPEYE